jgi:mono/diheme cytochrome c family protein
VRRAAKRALAAAGIAAALVVLGGVLVVATARPRRRPAPAVTVEPTPERLARGRYLTEHVLACFECHSEHDYRRYGAPIVGARGGGASCMGAEWGMPGRVCPPNITPHPSAGVGRWTDGELLRAIREGVDRDGRALFPQMPYDAYRGLSDEDAMAVVAYLRSLPASDRIVPASEIAFPASYFIQRAPRPLDGPVPAPPAEARGRYLATMAGCLFCHTPPDEPKGGGRLLAGGRALATPWGVLRTPNLTPHATGLTLSRASFISLFRAYRDPASQSPVEPADNTLMPWLAYAGMTDEDLGAIYDYLRSVPPVEHRIERRARPSVVEHGNPDG